MSTSNPYQAPGATVADVCDEMESVELPAVAGLGGSARYLAYTAVLCLAFGLLIGVSALIQPAFAWMLPVVTLVGILAAIALPLYRAYLNG